MEPSVTTKPEASSLRQILTLGVAGLISGLTLVGIYLVTLPAIQRNRAEALRAAVFEVVPGTTSIQPYELIDGELTLFEGGETELPEGEAVYAGFGDDGTMLGYAIPAEGPGFQDTVGMLYGFDPDNRIIIGLAILECRETPGLGDKIIFDETFHASFEALAVEPEIVTTKAGRSAPNEVDVISGATISSVAVVSALNQSVEYWMPLLTADDAEGGAP